MKKFACLVCAILFSATLFAGCNKSDSNTDSSTTYHAEFKNPVNGYIPFVDVTVDADKKITDVNYDWMKSDDKDSLKSEDEEYANTWRSVNPDMDQNQARTSLMDQLKEKQDISKVDSITGATMASSEFKELVAQLMEARIQKGNKKPLVIDNQAK